MAHVKRRSRAVQVYRATWHEVVVAVKVLLVSPNAILSATDAQKAVAEATSVVHKLEAVSWRGGVPVLAGWERGVGSADVSWLCCYS